LGGLRIVKPCGFPHCRCTDCDGNCRCAKLAAMHSQSLGMSQYFDLKYIVAGIVLGLLAFMLIRRRSLL
jgi:hypothetical protein